MRLPAVTRDEASEQPVSLIAFVLPLRLVGTTVPSVTRNFRRDTWSAPRLRPTST